MEPTRPENDPHAVVELLDTLLRDGAILQADVIITVADVPLVGLKLRAAIAGMATMSEYGLLEEWDRAYRERVAGDGDRDRDSQPPLGTTDDGDRE